MNPSVTTEPSVTESAETDPSVTTDHYRAVFDALTEGLCVLEMISGDDESADYRFVEVNRAFETATGLQDVTGSTYRELLPQVSILAPESYDRIARTATPERFVADSEAYGEPRRFDLYAFRLGDEGRRRVAVHFTDVTQRTLTEQELVDRSEQFSLVVCHDSGRLLWAAQGRNQQTLQGFFDALGEERCALVTHVSCDAAAWIHAGVKQNCPQAVICTDSFQQRAFGFHHPRVLIALAKLTLSGFKPALPGRA